MVGHGHLFHAQRKQAGKQLVQADRSHPAAVLCVQMQVGELGHFSRPVYPPGRQDQRRASKINDAKLC